MVTRKIKYPVTIFAALWMVMGAGFSRPVHADGPESAKDAPSLTIDAGFQPRLGTYYYCFEYNSMNIGTASISIRRDGDFYRMEVFARTNDTIDYIYKIRYRGDNITDLTPLSPVETRIQQTVKSKEKEIDIRFQDDGIVQTYETELKKGKVVDNEIRKIQAGRFITDPFSATYLARGLNWRTGAEQVFEVYTGKSRYELCLKCTGKALVQMPNGKREAWVIIPTAKQVDEKGSRHELKKKQPDIKLYLSADELKDVLRIEASHTIGSFLVLLDRFEPSAPNAGRKIASQAVTPEPDDVR